MMSLDAFTAGFLGTGPLCARPASRPPLGRGRQGGIGIDAPVAPAPAAGPMPQLPASPHGRAVHPALGDTPRGPRCQALGNARRHRPGALRAGSRPGRRLPPPAALTAGCRQALYATAHSLRWGRSRRPAAGTKSRCRKRPPPGARGTAPAGQPRPARPAVRRSALLGEAPPQTPAPEVSPAGASPMRLELQGGCAQDVSTFM